MEGLAGLKPSTSGKSKLLVLTDEGNGSFAGCPAEEGLQLASGWTSGRNLKRLQNSAPGVGNSHAHFFQEEKRRRERVKLTQGHTVWKSGLL